MVANSILAAVKGIQAPVQIQVVAKRFHARQTDAAQHFLNANRARRIPAVGVSVLENLRTNAGGENFVSGCAIFLQADNLMAQSLPSPCVMTLGTEDVLKVAQEYDFHNLLLQMQP